MSGTKGFIVASIVALLLLFVALGWALRCSSPPAPVPTPVPTATSTATVVVPTPTATVMPQPVATAAAPVIGDYGRGGLLGGSAP